VIEIGRAQAGLEKELESAFDGDSSRGDHAKALFWFGGYVTDTFRIHYGPLRGFSFKTTQMSVLLTVRWVKDGQPVVTFVTGVDVGNCIAILYRLAHSGEMSCVADKFG
jgi:hypothetical protein